ncbi:diacylglycerol kinase (ATP) [Peptoniphilus olsenii]|uniref:Diacylglycerol kinase (ATP) n=1 Tax=Peptoniphilus olsenii TaxID=411570 RepID=A0ABV2JC17_9FIRM
MKKVKIIANPNSGRGASLGKVLQLIKLFSQDEYKIILQFTNSHTGGFEYAKDDDGEDFIICCGGDGTVNEVVNGIYRRNRKVPLAILQSGTVNDFANSLNLPTSPMRFYQMIKNFKTKKIDLGLAGNRVFINVAAGGMLTEIAYTVSSEKKATLGNMAYYIEGVKELLQTNIFDDKNLLDLQIESDEVNGHERAMIFLITNSTSVGGFKKMAPFAEISDGYLDVLIFKKMDFFDVPELVATLVNGRHIDHNKVIYFKTKKLNIKCQSDVVIDLDGERASKLPMTFEVLEKELEIVVPEGGKYYGINY